MLTGGVIWSVYIYGQIYVQLHQNKNCDYARSYQIQFIYFLFFFFFAATIKKEFLLVAAILKVSAVISTDEEIDESEKLVLREEYKM